MHVQQSFRNSDGCKMWRKIHNLVNLVASKTRDKEVKEGAEAAGQDVRTFARARRALCGKPAGTAYFNRASFESWRDGRRDLQEGSRVDRLWAIVLARRRGLLASCWEARGQSSGCYDGG